MAAPTSTSRQLISTSGIVLKMSAKNRVKMPKEMTKFTMNNRISASDTRPPMKLPRLASTVLRTSDTSRMKPMVSTIVKERKRSLMIPTMPRLGLGLTPKMVFMASCNWVKTPDAPNSSRARPNSVGSNSPLPGCSADWRMV